MVPSADDNRYCAAAERSISKEAAELDRRRHYSHVAAVTKNEKRKEKM